jgi:hypothetical protein
MSAAGTNQYSKTHFAPSPPRPPPTPTPPAPALPPQPPRPPLPLPVDPGEFALRHLLEPFAWPKLALEERLHELKVPVTFMYGDVDWMSPDQGRAVCKALEAGRGKMSETDLKVTVRAGRLRRGGAPLPASGQSRKPLPALPAAAQHAGSQRRMPGIEELSVTLSARGVPTPSVPCPHAGAAD